jgi:hypothetical protein
VGKCFSFVQIRGTWETINLNGSSKDLRASVITSSTTTALAKYAHQNNSSITTSTTSKSFSSLRTLIYKYFQRNRSNKSLKKEVPSTKEKPGTVPEAPINVKNDNDYPPQVRRKRRSTSAAKKVQATTRSSVSTRHAPRQATTVTFTGQKRCMNELDEETRAKSDSTNYQDADEQLVRARLSTRTSSLPAARCLSYYYYHHQRPKPSQTIITHAIIEGHPRDSNHAAHHPTAVVHERSRSQSQSSAQYLGNDAIAPVDLSEHSSSFDNPPDEDHRRLHRHTQQSQLSTSYHSSRYSQRAVAQFMHERHKARLRRNQKASRMLGT